MWHESPFVVHTKHYDNNSNNRKSFKTKMYNKTAKNKPTKLNHNRCKKQQSVVVCSFVVIVVAAAAALKASQAKWSIEPKGLIENICYANFDILKP